MSLERPPFCKILIHVQYDTSDKILLDTFISKGNPQAVDENTETDGKVFGALKNFLRFIYDWQHRHTVVYL